MEKREKHQNEKILKLTSGNVNFNICLYDYETPEASCGIEVTAENPFINYHYQDDRGVDFGTLDYWLDGFEMQLFDGCFEGFVMPRNSPYLFMLGAENSKDPGYVQYKGKKIQRAAMEISDPNIQFQFNHENVVKMYEFLLDVYNCHAAVTNGAHIFAAVTSEEA